jgi:hypothetical protein
VKEYSNTKRDISIKGAIYKIKDLVKGPCSIPKVRFITKDNGVITCPMGPEKNLASVEDSYRALLLMD